MFDRDMRATTAPHLNENKQSVLKCVELRNGMTSGSWFKVGNNGILVVKTV